MQRISLFLAFLLVVLTFNAYACILPLQQSAAKDCPSGTEEEPVRGPCDAFVEIGPSSQASSSHASVNTVALEYAVPEPHLPDYFVPLVRINQPPGRADTSIHRSIHTTVLRI